MGESMRNTVQGFWVTRAIEAVVVLGMLQLIYGGDMFNLQSIAISTVLLAVGARTANWILGRF